MTARFNLVIAFFISSFVLFGRPNIVFACDKSQPNSFLATATDCNLENDKNSALIISNNNPNYPVQYMASRFDSLTMDEAEHLYESLIQKHDVLVSTENEEIIRRIVQNRYTQKQLAQRQILDDETETINPKDFQTRIMPIGKLLATKPVTAITNAAQQFKTHYDNSIKNDRIGVFILLINTAKDTFVWFHADPNIYNMSERNSIIILNTIVAATFGMNKDLWASWTKPIRERMIFLFDKLGRKKITTSGEEIQIENDEAYGRENSETSNQSQTRKKKSILSLAPYFLSNLTLSVALQTVRLGLINFHQITQSFSSPEFWEQSLAISSIMTFSTFAFSEQLAAVDQEKNPVAKNALRRFMELRSFLMALFYNSGTLFQFHEYGWTPWVANFVVGSAGAMILLFSEPVTNWLETQKWIQKSYKYFEKFDQFLDRPVSSFMLQSEIPRQGLMCSAVFE